ncbi:MAG: FkbM family methyltransferase [Pseudomonadota bacterium]
MTRTEGLNLKTKDRLHLFLHNLISPLGVDGLRPVTVSPDGDGYRVETEGKAFHVPSALVWRQYRRGWAERQARLLREFGIGIAVDLGPSDTVLDVGANVGDFAVATAERCARVIAVDGDPAVVACLKRNIDAADNILALCHVLWKEAGPLTFHSAPSKSDSSIFQPPGEDSTALVIDATTLDLLAETHGIDQLAVLKMDAEGAEPEVLEGGKALLARTRFVSIDTGPERLGETTTDTVAKMLAAQGFTVLPQNNQRRVVTMALRND